MQRLAERQGGRRTLTRTGSPARSWLLLLLLGGLGAAVPLRRAAAKEPPSALCAREGDFWSRPKSAAGRRGCALLVRALARLESEPQLALGAARQARSALVESHRAEASSALWLEGAAQLLLGQNELGARAFDEAAQETSRPLPTVLLLYRARSRAASQKADAALADYRLLLGRSDGQLGAELGRALLEASFSALASQEPRLAEARSFAEEAERAAQPLLVPYARALRAWIDRRSEPASAADRRRPWAEESTLGWLLGEAPEAGPRRGGFLPFLPNAQLSAFRAFVEGEGP